MNRLFRRTNRHQFYNSKLKGKQLQKFIHENCRIKVKIPLAVNSTVKPNKCQGLFSNNRITNLPFHFLNSFLCSLNCYLYFFWLKPSSIRYQGSNPKLLSSESPQGHGSLPHFPFYFFKCKHSNCNLLSLRNKQHFNIKQRFLFAKLARRKIGGYLYILNPFLLFFLEILDIEERMTSRRTRR